MDVADVWTSAVVAKLFELPLVAVEESVLEDRPGDVNDGEDGAKDH